MREIALYWLAYEITGSAIALGILGLCEATPRLALSVVGGVIVDRYDRLRLLTIVQFSCAVPVFAMVGLYFAGVLQFWHMAVLETILSVIRSMNPTAGQSLLHDLVPETDLMGAVALYSLEFNCARIIGPSLGGLLMIWIDVGGCLTFYGVTLLLSGIELLLMRMPALAAPERGAHWLQEIREGIRYIQNAPLILSSTLAAYALSMFVGTYQRFLPVFAKDILHVGPDDLGALMAASGAGAVISLVFLEAASSRWRRETLLWFSAKATPFAAHSFLCLAPLMDFHRAAGSPRRYADSLSHRQSPDYPGGSAAGAIGPRNEYFPHGPRHALRRLYGDGNMRDFVRRRFGIIPVFGCFHGAHGGDLMGRLSNHRNRALAPEE